MGEHKHNPTAIAAKNGELPPKKKNMSKREWERKLRAAMLEKMYKKTGLASIDAQLNHY